MRSLFAIVLFGLATGCLAQSRIPVFVTSSTGENDAVGQQLVYEIKEAIRGSRGFALIEDSNRWPYIRFSIVTSRVSENLTAVSHVFTFDGTEIPLNGALITHYVQYCGRDVVRGCAGTIMGSLDSAVDSLRRRDAGLYRQLQ